MVMENSNELFQHSITVGWADCDPALIAYTGRIPYFALEAIDSWWKFATGDNWFELNVDRNIGTPFVHMSLDFRSPITPRHQLICDVSLIHIGNASLRFKVVGRQNGTLCFEGEFVNVVVVADTMKSQRPPLEILQKIEKLLSK